MCASNVEEYLTGYRLEDFPDGEAEDNTDPNWARIWGDSVAGMVVTVLDCSLVDVDDVDEVALLAGPEGQLPIIQVPHTFAALNEFRRSLLAQLQAASTEGDDRIDSTLTGRDIEVRVLDQGEFPDDFVSQIPERAYSIVETDELSSEE
jgi:hypothetical protein